MSFGQKCGSENQVWPPAPQNCQVHRNTHSSRSQHHRPATQDLSSGNPAVSGASQGTPCVPHSRPAPPHTGHTPSGSQHFEPWAEVAVATGGVGSGGVGEGHLGRCRPSGFWWSPRLFPSSDHTGNGTGPPGQVSPSVGRSRWGRNSGWRWGTQAVVWGPHGPLSPHLAALKCLGQHSRGRDTHNAPQARRVWGDTHTQPECLPPSA